MFKACVLNFYIFCYKKVLRKYDKNQMKLLILTKKPFSFSRYLIYVLSSFPLFFQVGQAEFIKETD